MHYLWWIPLAIVYYSGYAYLSKGANDNGADWPFWMLWGAGLLGPWPLVTQVSKSLVFDGFLFDLIAMITYVSVLASLGAMQSFTPVQYIGLGLAVLGVVLMKWSPL